MGSLGATCCRTTLNSVDVNSVDLGPTLNCYIITL